MAPERNLKSAKSLDDKSLKMVRHGACVCLQVSLDELKAARGLDSKQEAIEDICRFTVKVAQVDEVLKSRGLI